MKSAIVLAAALAASAGCYKTTYLMSPNGGGNPSTEYSDHYHWSIINLIEPVILIVMGGVIATILLSVYLPMFTILSNIKS